ncbi:TraB/GumN family protein [Barnesiella sp. WM24]|uniref:TraB/GumN family protein n=1 Tax=Barnesiella sp. WM24 TaxID=2558278 RepID=UPI0014306875|nr:TraB/GumN family protein [Barnesiella sp. WM24]
MKKILFSIAAIAMALSTQAQLLWKVTGGDSKGDSYIFGTHHIAPVAILDSIQGFADALNSVSTVYGELEMAEMTSPAVQQVAMRHSMAPADSTLSKLLSAEQLDSVSAVLGKYTGGMLTAAALDPMKPVVVSTQLGVMQSMVAFPEFTGQQQLDQVIQERAQLAGKTVKGLETAEQQFAILMGGSLSRQAEQLMKDIRKEEKTIEDAKTLAAAYMSADLDAMERLFNDPETGMSPETAKALIYDRNDNWIAQLREILPADKVMIVVGAGHLVGEKGILSQLRNAGYEVTAVD